MATNGYKWLQIAPNSSKWLKITPNGLKWLQMAPIVVSHCKKALKGSKKVPKRAKSKGEKKKKKIMFPSLPQNDSKLLQTTPNESKWFEMAHHDSKWLEMA